MSTVEKLKKKAAEFEQKKQFDRALEVYLQIIGQTEGQEDRDVTVYNRVGDLYLRLNKTDQAVNYYEQAVDLYTDGGYLNNAIALCNKILRHAPSRHQIYYKLGKISAKKGFNSDAKKNFLEYADRMHRAGRDGDAFKALQEFADLCPGQDDIRLMLADQLARAGKKSEAIEQLQILHESLDAEGRTNEAEATVQRIHTLDPSVEPRHANSPRQKEAGGLVFLDLGAGSPAKPRPKVAGLERTSLMPEMPPRPRTPPHVQPSPEFEQLPDIEPTPDTELPGLEIQRGASVEDIEPAFDLSVSDADVSPLEGLESAADPEAFVIDPGANVVESGVEGLIPMTSAEPGLGEPLETDNPLAGLNIIEEGFYIRDENPAAAEEKPPAPASKSSASRHAEPAADEVPQIDTIELEEPELQEETKEHHAPPPRKVAHRTPPKQEPEREEQNEEQGRHHAPEVLKQSKLKVVQPVRPTRPKPKVEKETPREPEPEESGKRPLNPFQRQRPKAKPASPKSSPRLTTPEAEIPRAATPKENPPQRAGDENFVDLADWMREDSGPRSYRMVAEEDKRAGEEQADFTDMLEKFKAGVARNVDDEDFDSHYDLGVAYREMGLIDEAIFEFQKALRGATQRIRAYEALGQCFIDRSEFDVAITILSRALREPGMEDEDLIGVLYLLGYASEESRKPRDAAAYYHRVFAIDIDFRDVSKRLKSMSKAASK